jgi:hypothetical protein
MTLAVFVNGALLAIIVFAVLLVVWGYGMALARMAAMSDRRVARLHCSPRAKGTSDASPPCAPLVPARVREVVTGDEQ